MSVQDQTVLLTTGLLGLILPRVRSSDTYRDPQCVQLLPLYGMTCLGKKRWEKMLFQTGRLGTSASQVSMYLFHRGIPLSVALRISLNSS